MKFIPPPQSGQNVLMQRGASPIPQIVHPVHPAIHKDAGGAVGNEALGAYVYMTLKNGGELDQSRLEELMAEIDVHKDEIARIEAEAAAKTDNDSKTE